MAKTFDLDRSTSEQPRHRQPRARVAAGRPILPPVDPSPAMAAFIDAVIIPALVQRMLASQPPSKAA